MVWLKFALCLVAILFAGTRLARYGDAIAEKTGLGRVWIGLVLLAAITSIPELVTGVSSVALVGLPDLAMGTLVGSCGLNLALIALLDLLHRGVPVLSVAIPRHALSAGVGVLLVGIVALTVLVGGKLAWLSVGWVGVTSIVVLVIYLGAMWWMFRREQNCQALPDDTCATYGHLSTRTVCLRFCLWAAVVIAAGIWLSYVGAELGETTGWNSTFVGSVFLAVTTSAPELVVTVACLRLGAVDMAVADILGSNMFNIAIVAPVDLFYREGPLLSMASPNNLITAGVVIVMNIVVIAALKLPQKRKALGFVTWYVPLLIALYVFAAYAVFHSGWGP